MQEYFRLASDGFPTIIEDRGNGTYLVRVDFFTDLTGFGYLPTQIEVGDNLYTQLDQIYRITNVVSSDFTGATLELLALNLYGIVTDAAPAFGQVFVWRPYLTDKIPQVPFATSGSGANLQAMIDTWNARIDKFGGDGGQAIPGPQGPKGETGPQGTAGEPGPDGPIGAQGPQGTRGDTGLPGPQGEQGVKGEQGLRGPAGLDGVSGVDGLNGVPGRDGADGLDGRDGVDGGPYYFVRQGDVIFLEQGEGDNFFSLISNENSGPGTGGGGKLYTSIEAGNSSLTPDSFDWQVASNSNSDYPLGYTATAVNLTMYCREADIVSPKVELYINDLATGLTVGANSTGNYYTSNIELLIEEGDRINFKTLRGSSTFPITLVLTLSQDIPLGTTTGESVPGPRGFKGDTGEPGPRGEDGVNGIDGPRGIPGPRGEEGPQGVPGQQGVTGIKGDKGDVGEAGPQGGMGPQGPQGVAGTQGVAGPQGIPGPEGSEGGPGIAGPQGPQGVQGEMGEQGPQGPQGATGPMGFDGEQGPRGFDGESGPEGAQGPSGLQGQRGEVGPTGSEGPAGERGLRGLQGDAGPEGADGPRGEQGVQGEQGEQGLQGIPGPEGVPGPGGPEGPLGEKGSQGEQGIPGIQGPVGSQGDLGPVGPAGLQGEKGDPGIKGDRGEEGLPGPKGDRGDQGVPGTTANKGDKGDPGIQGLQGERGLQGIQGEKGDQGADGLDGVGGLDGAQGVPGVKGDKGDTGDIGPEGPRGGTGVYEGPTDPVYAYQTIWAEQSGSVGQNNGFEWSFGNGVESRPSFGLRIDYACTAVSLSLQSFTNPNPGVQIVLYVNGVASALVTADTGGRNYGTGVVPINAGDHITFKTEVGSGGASHTIALKLRQEINSTFVSQEGPEGPQGTQGIPGTQGETGQQGDQGIQGIQGEQGLPGPEGVQGERGLQGVPGERGLQGVAGAQGAKGDQGEIGLSGPQGERGFIGPEGIQGEPGIKGDRGDIGPIGTQGPQGPAGIEGPQGPTGSQGVSGEKGDKGNDGEQGIPGIRGPVGPQGQTGEQGPQGATGVAGLKGDKGDRGDQGEVGPVGDTGPRGIQGNDGIDGQAGIRGERGERGSDGAAGEPGPSGPRGNTGERGPEGPAGKAVDLFDGSVDYGRIRYVNREMGVRILRDGRQPQVGNPFAPFDNLQAAYNAPDLREKDVFLIFDSDYQHTELTGRPTNGGGVKIGVDKLQFHFDNVRVKGVGDADVILDITFFNPADGALDMSQYNEAVRFDIKVTGNLEIDNCILFRAYKEYTPSKLFYLANPGTKLPKIFADIKIKSSVNTAVSFNGYGFDLKFSLDTHTGNNPFKLNWFNDIKAGGIELTDINTALYSKDFYLEDTGGDASGQLSFVGHRDGGIPVTGHNQDYYVDSLYIKPHRRTTGGTRMGYYSRLVTFARNNTVKNSSYSFNINRIIPISFAGTPYIGQGDRDYKNVGYNSNTPSEQVRLFRLSSNLVNTKIVFNVGAGVCEDGFFVFDFVTGDKDSRVDIRGSYESVEQSAVKFAQTSTNPSTDNTIYILDGKFSSKNAPAISTSTVPFITGTPPILRGVYETKSPSFPVITTSGILAIAEATLIGESRTSGVDVRPVVESNTISSLGTIVYHGDVRFVGANSVPFLNSTVSPRRLPEMNPASSGGGGGGGTPTNTDLQLVDRGTGVYEIKSSTSNQTGVLVQGSGGTTLNKSGNSLVITSNVSGGNGTAADGSKKFFLDSSGNDPRLALKYIDGPLAGTLSLPKLKFIGQGDTSVKGFGNIASGDIDILVNSNAVVGKFRVNLGTIGGANVPVEGEADVDYSFLNIPAKVYHISATLEGSSGAESGSENFTIRNLGDISRFRIRWNNFVPENSYRVYITLFEPTSLSVTPILRPRNGNY